jgi:hypothetical protein
MKKLINTRYTYAWTICKKKKHDKIKLHIPTKIKKANNHKKSTKLNPIRLVPSGVAILSRRAQNRMAGLPLRLKGFEINHKIMILKESTPSIMVIRKSNGM